MSQWWDSNPPWQTSPHVNAESCLLHKIVGVVSRGRMALFVSSFFFVVFSFPHLFFETGILPHPRPLTPCPSSPPAGPRVQTPSPNHYPRRVDTHRPASYPHSSSLQHRPSADYSVDSSYPRHAHSPRTPTPCSPAGIYRSSSPSASPFARLSLCTRCSGLRTPGRIGS